MELVISIFSYLLAGINPFFSKCESKKEYRNQILFHSGSFLVIVLCLVVSVLYFNMTSFGYFVMAILYTLYIVPSIVLQMVNKDKTYLFSFLKSLIFITLVSIIVIVVLVLDVDLKSMI